MVPYVRILAVSCCVALLSACGGGQGGTNQMNQMAATGSPVTVAGTVTGTSSALKFNQQALNTASAVVTVNGRPGSAADLQPGTIVHGKGTKSGQTIHLTSADVRPDLSGPISAVDLTGSHLTVLGTVVTVDALTVLVQEGPDHSFTPLSLADFKVSDVVHVFGSVQTDGSFHATRIERRMPGDPEGEELRGVMAGLDATASTFMIGSITVAYGTATVHGTLVNGARVEVEGMLSGSTFTATRVEVENEAEDAPGSAMEVSGTLSTLDATVKTFTLLTFKVDYSAAVVKGTLVDGAVVEVEGSLSTTTPGTILATQVEVRFDHDGEGASDEEAKGAITALNLANLTFTLGGTTYWTDAQTVFIRSDAGIAFTDLKLGDLVEVRALSTKTNTSGQPYASRVEEEGPN